MGREGTQEWGRRPKESKESQKRRKEGGAGSIGPCARDSGRVLDAGLRESWEYGYSLALMSGWWGVSSWGTVQGFGLWSHS